MQKVYLAKYNNKFYKPGSNLKLVLWYFVNLLFFNSYIPYPVSIKIFLLKLFDGIVGDNIIIKPKVSIKYPWLLVIGDNVWIGENVWIDNLESVTIGNNVCISQGAMLLTGNHNYKSSSFDLIREPIVLEDGVWIGAQSVVCPGVICKSHSILSVGSVATKSLSSYMIYQGNPALPVRKRIINL